MKAGCGAGRLVRLRPAEHATQIVQPIADSLTPSGAAAGTAGARTSSLAHFRQLIIGTDILGLSSTACSANAPSSMHGEVHRQPTCM